MSQYAPLASKEETPEDHEEKHGLLTSSRDDNPKADRAFLIAYVVCMVLWLVLGCITLTTSSPVYEKNLDPYSCQVKSRRGLMQTTDDVPSWVLYLAWASVILLPPLAARLLLMACTAFPRVIVYGTMYFHLALFGTMLVSGTIFAGAAGTDHVAFPGAVGAASFGGVLLLVYGIIYFSLRKRLAFVSSMLGTASACITQARGVLHVCLATFAVGLLAETPLLGLTVAIIMRQNNFIPNPNVTTHDKGACTDAFHNTVSCCILDTERPPALMTIAGVVMIGWTGAIILGVRRFCIGGVVRDWYFAPPGVVQNTTHKHLRRALTESLGCIAVGALIQSLVQAIRGLCENRVLRCIMRVIESYVNWLTTYALLYAGMTGMSFFPAARKSHNLLTSNFLEVASVGLIPGTLLGLVGATISMLIGWGVFAMTWVLGVPTVPKDHDGSMTMVFSTALVFGLIAFMFSCMCIGFVSGMVVDVTNVVYLCFALDREHASVTKPQVHESFAKLAAPAGVVVEQPGGDIAYAPVLDVELQSSPIIMTDGVFRSQGMWQVILTRAYIDTDPIVVGACASESEALRLHAAALQAYQEAPEGLRGQELRQHVVEHATAIQPTITHVVAAPTTKRPTSAASSQGTKRQATTVRRPPASMSNSKTTQEEQRTKALIRRLDRLMGL